MKFIAHILTCIALSGYLELKFELTGAKFWIIYLVLATLIWTLNTCSDK